MENPEVTKARCGKSCESCLHRQSLNCPGCMTWNSASLSRSCEIAQCCISKGHQQCATCQFCDTCYKRQKREQMAATITRNRLAQEATRTRLNQRAAEVGPRLWILFWLFIPRLIGSFMSGEDVYPVFPGIYWLGVILLLGYDLTRSVILIWLGRVSRHYKISGWCNVGAMLLAVVSVGLTVLPAPVWLSKTVFSLLSLAELVLGLVSLYNYFHGHMDALSGYDNGLKEKWAQLWKWYLICGGTLIGSFILIFLPTIAVMAIFAALIGIVVLTILEMIYLYQTARFFRFYQQQTEAPDAYHPYAP